MSRAGKTLELGGLVVPIAAGLQVQQAVEYFGGKTRLRFANGAGLNQVAWEKMRITLSCDGWIPPGTDALNYTTPLVLKCPLPESVLSASPVVTLPTARRTDAGYAPYAWAHTPDGPQNVALTLSGNVATCTTVAGAVAYTVMYYPQITALCDRPTTSASRASVAWELVAEEV